MSNIIFYSVLNDNSYKEFDSVENAIRYTHTWFVLKMERTVYEYFNFKNPKLLFEIINTNGENGIEINNWKTKEIHTTNRNWNYGDYSSTYPTIKLIDPNGEIR